MKALKTLAIAALTILSVTVFAQEKAGKKDSLKHTTHYTCAMHDSIVRKKPGNCPVCGMKLECSKNEQLKTSGTKNYSCPMKCEGDKTYAQAGNCPSCGMSLREVKTEDQDYKH